MKLTSAKWFIAKFIACLLLVSCGDIEQNQRNTETPTKVGIQQLNLNGKILVPFPIQLKNLQDPPSGNSTTKDAAVFEFNPSKNEMFKSNFVLPKNYIGVVLINDLHYIATSQAIATYILKPDGLERQSFLPTPKGNFIASIFSLDNSLVALTISDFNLNFWLLVNNEWQIHRKIDYDKLKMPESDCKYIANELGQFILWSKNKTLYCFNLANESNKIVELPFSNLTHTSIWSNAEKIFLSGFNINSELIHYELKNLETQNITSIKTDFGNYPEFNAPIKYMALMPIIINQEIKGFIYGAIGENIIYINSDKKEFPTNLISEYQQKIKALFLTNIGVFTFVIAILCLLSYKIAKAWEGRLAKLTIPANALFFGPTLHRGIAFCIDLLTILQISLIFSYFVPFQTNIFLEMLNSLSMENQQIYASKQYPFLIASYIISLIYGTLSEYFFGCTLGKFCLGLRVFSDKNLSKINIFQALGRNIIPKFSPNIYLILVSNISISVTQKKKSLHDYLGNTVVLYSRLHTKLNLKISQHKL